METGHILLTLSVSDADSKKYGGPFKMEIEGEGAGTVERGEGVIEE